LSAPHPASLKSSRRSTRSRQQAREIFDFVIVVMGGHFAVVVGIARQTAGLPDSFLLATAAPQFLDTSFLTAAHQKNSNETASKGGA
jgi:hypothetical protein